MMSPEEINLETARRNQQQRLDALVTASRHLPGTNAAKVVKAATEFHKFLTGV